MNFDSSVVEWVNGHNSAFMDEFMWFVSQPTTWIPLYLLLLLLFWFRVKNWHTLLIILIGFVIAVGLSDFICSGVLKPLVGRLRPHYSDLVGLHKVHNYMGGRYSFCSSHAANAMAIALLFSLLYRKTIATVLLMLWVALICYSRLYLAAHYPTDLLAGLMVGSLMAVLAWLVLSIVYRVDDAVLPRGDS